MWRSLLALPLLLPLVGCKESDGENLRQIARKAGEKLDRAARPVGDAASPLRGSLGEHSAAARADSRIRHDRYLAGHRFTVRGEGPIVTVTATVPDASMKTRALDLARSTVGVEDVIDEVKVAAE